MPFPPQLGLGVALALLSVCYLSAAHAQTGSPATEAARGKAYARETCASCHEVEPGILTPPFAKARSFSSIAATPGMTSMALNVWFSTSHPTMPNLIIPQKQKEDLMAYFSTLRAASKQAEPDQ
jgi:mono/diheme cytochrome c family protein